MSLHVAGEGVPEAKSRRRTGPAFVLRKIHRWLAVLLALFMAVIALTGAVLQLIMVGYGEIRHGGRDLPASIRPLHDLMFRIHTGAIVRPVSDYYGLICGLGLLYFSLSGVWMYVDLYRKRRAAGRHGLFWSSGVLSDAVWRSLHRWLTVAMVAFVALLGLTASSLNIDYLRFNTYPGGSPSDPRGMGPPGGDWHELNYFIHKLSFMGQPGHWLGCLVGISLFVFSVSGTSMYLAMHGRRSRAGLKKMFW